MTEHCYQSEWATFHQILIHLMATRNYISCAYPSTACTCHPFSLMSLKWLEHFLLNIKDPQLRMFFLWYLCALSDFLLQRCYNQHWVGLLFFFSILFCTNDLDWSLQQVQFHYSWSSTVFSIWKSLEILREACIKFVTRPSYTYFFVLFLLL